MPKHEACQRLGRSAAGTDLPQCVTPRRSLAAADPLGRTSRRGFPQTVPSPLRSGKTTVFMQVPDPASPGVGLEQAARPGGTKKVPPPTSQNDDVVVYGALTVPSGITVHRGPMR